MIARIGSDIGKHYGFDAYERLLWAIILQAIKDACNEDPRPTPLERREAQFWLDDRRYVPLCRLLQIPASVVAGVVRRTC